MTIQSFDHYTVRSGDLDASWRFYEQALGLKVVKREGAAVPAAIVSIGDTQVVHLFQASQEMEAIFARMPSSEALEGWNTGRLHHVEFWAAGLPETRERLTKLGLPFSEATLPDKHQMRLRDPDGIAVNLNFQLSEIQGRR
jgi:catechol 2,3-dioxygenase-like lactoylglutathione lyase family enzyme